MENYQHGRKVLDQIDAKPESFDMFTWVYFAYNENEERCGTVACLAGHTMLQAGFKYDGVRFWRPDGTITSSYTDEAEKILGLTTEEVHDGTELWFDSETGLERFRRMVEDAERAAAEEI